MQNVLQFCTEYVGSGDYHRGKGAFLRAEIHHGGAGGNDSCHAPEIGGGVMDNSIVVGLLSLAGTLIGSLAGIMTANKLTNYRIGKLEEKVNKHNSLIERMVVVEQSTKSAHHRIDEMEERMK